MTAPAITILYNNSSNNLPNSGGGDGDANWLVLNPSNDKISFLASTIYDGDSITSREIFKIPENGSQEIPKQCVRDYASQTWKRIYLAGSDADSGLGGNYRYALGIHIDGTSNSVPVLQAWDSITHSTYNLEVLGSGTPANSMLRAVVTTNTAPGAAWAGTPLAGSGGVNSLALDTTAVTSSRMLYWNMRLLVPSTASSFAASPVLCVYFTYS